MLSFKLLLIHEFIIIMLVMIKNNEILSFMSLIRLNIFIFSLRFKYFDLACYFFSFINFDKSMIQLTCAIFEQKFISSKFYVSFEFIL
jgi:hypothetical protein